MTRVTRQSALEKYQSELGARYDFGYEDALAWKDRDPCRAFFGPRWSSAMYDAGYGAGVKERMEREERRRASLPPKSFVDRTACEQCERCERRDPQSTAKASP